MAGALGRRSLTTTPAAWAMPQTLTATVFLVWASSISSSSAAALYYSLKVSHFVFASPIFLASLLASRDFTVIQTMVCSLTLQTNVLARLAMTSTAWALPSTTTTTSNMDFYRSVHLASLFFACLALHSRQCFAVFPTSLAQRMDARSR